MIINSMRLFLFLLCGLFGLGLNAQTNSNSSTIIANKFDFSFIDFLISNAEFEDALLLLSNASNQIAGTDEALNDSLNYYKGIAYYNIKQLDSSASYFEKIKSHSTFYLKSKFYENFEHIYLGAYTTADQKLKQMQLVDSTLIELKRFQEGASALLQNDFDRFNQVGNSFKYNNFACAEEQRELFKRRDELLQNKKKSPLLAGLMSAVVPGSGKFYAGYRGQALSSMFPTLIFAASAAEAYYRAGPKSFQFIAAASIFSIFYVGNIWGSVLSVKTFYEIRNNEIRNNIMLDLHIPLRRIFSN